ncbi:XkdX family protein [Clostridium tyrobutyricum]|nr:XkdX family protein [Clostridium tyrobutyricum]MBV4445496.1 XkdX family protein [Clostridium tyrobutyricum]
MDWLKTISSYYSDGYYTVDQVKVFVAKGKITADQFKQITGQDYIA